MSPRTPVEMRDINRIELFAALRSYGFRLTAECYVCHPEIAGGKPLQFDVMSNRQALADLVVQLREARARQRGGHFVTHANSNSRTRQLVAVSLRDGARA